MPELPDIELYLHALNGRIVGRRLDRIRLASPFLVRSVDPPVDQAHGRTVVALRRLGKRIVMQLDGELFLVIHLMIAGRFKWIADPRAAEGADRSLPKIPGKLGLAAFDFANGTLILTEAGSKRRASMYLVKGEAALAEHDPGGLEVLTSSVASFGDALTRENHTLKRALTDPHLLSGIGNAYSDEILHAAKLSPMLLTSKLIDGTFPEYERVIPRGNDKILRVGKNDFAAAVGRVSAISSERSRPVKLAIERDLLVLSAASPEQGTATEELDGERVSYGSTPLEIGFQARYLTDITDQVAEQVEFLFQDGSAPTVVRDADDTSALFVLMPMRV